MMVLIRYISIKPPNGDLYANRQIKTVHKGILKKEITISKKYFNKTRKLTFIHLFLTMKIKRITMSKLKLVMGCRQLLSRERREFKNLKQNKCIVKLKISLLGKPKSIFCREKITIFKN